MAYSRMTDRSLASYVGCRIAVRVAITALLALHGCGSESEANHKGDGGPAGGGHTNNTGDNGSSGASNAGASGLGTGESTGSSAGESTGTSAGDSSGSTGTSAGGGSGSTSSSSGSTGPATGGTPGGGSCAAGCASPTPICGPDLKCTSSRRIEPISTLPDKWKTKLDTSVWTKWVRSVIPVVGQAGTQDAALLEVAYFAEKIHMPNGEILVPDLVNSMLGDHPTRFSVYPACPNAWMHPNVMPTQSSGGGGDDNTLVTEDWILRYPKCTGKDAVACNLVTPGTLCNNCGWANSDPETCRDTLAHEHGHTIDGHRKRFIDTTLDAIDKQVFPSNSTEGPAWSASKYFMNPSLETAMGRDRGAHIMSSEELNYWSVTQKFTMSKYAAGSGYILKTTRCPGVGLTQPCPDTLTRTYSVPLDSAR